MRDFTKEEANDYKRAIDRLSEPTGINLLHKYDGDRDNRDCHGIHLYEFEDWIIDKINELSKNDNKDKTLQQIAESKFLHEILIEIVRFLNE